MNILPPGNILQHIYLKERINKRHLTNFLDIGAGNGYISNELLSIGLTGIGCDLNQEACLNNHKLNASYVSQSKYRIHTGNFLELNTAEKYDLIISSMVIEHLPEDVLKQFLNKCKELLNKGGVIIFLVPSSMKYWGIEDEIAGHIKRYEYSDFVDFEKRYSLRATHIAGLTFPMSNILFRISNFLVGKFENSKLKLSQQEKTIHTGNREVPYKTSFPKVLGFILNEYVLLPLHLIQKLFIKNKNAMVIYCELEIV